VTKFSFEVPLPHLLDFHEDQDYIFALSFLFQRDGYGMYIRECVGEGMQVIIDNSYNELREPEPLKDLIQLFLEYGAEAFVVPDSDEWSPTEQIYSYHQARELVAKERIWPVARWPREIEEFHAQQASLIAIPYEYRNFLNLNKIKMRMHFLGLRNPGEILTHKPISVDTSMPLKLALKGMTVREWIMMSCPHFHTHKMLDFFDYKMTLEEVKLCKKNIKDIKAICAGDFNCIQKEVER